MVVLIVPMLVVVRRVGRGGGGSVFVFSVPAAELPA